MKCPTAGSLVNDAHHSPYELNNDQITVKNLIHWDVHLFIPSDDSGGFRLKTY